MTDEPKTYVFDTGPLRHFTLRGWLGILKFVTRDFRVVIPESVENEIRFQAGSQPSLVQVLDADWITVDRRCDPTFLEAFAGFERHLVNSEGRNRGECGVLALGQVSQSECILVLDDGTARRLASDHKMTVRGTLGLLCEAVRGGQLEVSLVSAVADDLLSGAYRLPFEPGGFERWARGEGVI